MSIIGTVQPNLRRRKINTQKLLVIFLFAVVPLFLLILFTYVPFVKMIQFSFHNMSYTKDKGFVGFDLKVCLRHFKRELLLSKSILLHRDNLEDVFKRESRHLKTKLSLLHLNPRSKSVVDGHHARAQLLNVGKPP